MKNVWSADRIVLVDTGSADNTVALARKIGSDHPDFRIIQMYPEAHDGPVHYDTARNMSFAGASEDMFVMWLDLDERFEGADWADVISQLPLDVTAAYVVMNTGGTRYHQLKGARGGTHTWRYSVHEVLTSLSRPVSANVVEFETHHYQEYGKTYRSFHLDLLTEDMARFPNDQRVAFYLLRQHCYKLTEMLGRDVTEVSNATIVRYYEQEMSPLLDRVMRLDPHHDYATWALIEVSRAIQSVSDLSQEAVIHALTAYCNRPDRPETLGQVAIAHYYNNENLACMGYALRCAECNVAEYSNFMFDSSQMYREHVVDYLYLAAESLDLLDKAIFYANKYGRHDLVERGGERLVGQTDAGSAASAYQAAS